MPEVFEWSHKDIKLTGFSLAGISTTIGFPQADACFDVAQGFTFQIPYNNFLISHGHMDHASGIPYLIGQKAMRGAGKPKFYMPDELRGPLNEIMKLWGQIEDHTYDFEFHSPKINETHPLKGPYHFRPFPTFHRVPSQGYTIFQRKKRLKAEHQGQSPSQLGLLRKQKIEIEEFYDEPQVSFTGDTKIEFLDSPQVRASRVLLMEVTYWDIKKPVAVAREWGHIHLEELIPRLDDLTCEKIVLIHTSARYSSAQLLKILNDRIPAQHQARVELFPRLN